MAYPREGPQELSDRRIAHRALLVTTLLFVLAAVSVSVGLVVYTAWTNDLKNGLSAILFAALSTRAALSWVLWQDHEEGFTTPK
jgi:hypothetical protein